MKDKEQKVDCKSKSGGLLFLVSIILLYILGCISLIAFLFIITTVDYPSGLWLRVIIGFSGAMALFSHSGLDHLRTFIHEAKHAFVVIITGSSLQEFRATKTSGHVTYQMGEENEHLTPWITLAPYCFPLFSLPFFLCCLLTSVENHHFYVTWLAIFLGIDFTTGLHEMHVGQTDLSRIFGGFFVSASFIGGMFFSWFSLCLLWIVGGNDGLIVFLGLGLEMVRYSFQQLISE